MLASGVTGSHIYGASLGSEMCQHVIGQLLEGLPNARNIADDILVHGTTKEEHYKSLESTLLHLYFITTRNTGKHHNPYEIFRPYARLNKA